MRDYRDPKAMAKTVREFLAAKNISLKHSESLELVSKMLGFLTGTLSLLRFQTNGLA